MNSRSGFLRALLASAILLAGCATWSPTPALRFPPRPELRWGICSTPAGQSFLCLTEEDGVKLLRWMDQVSAFETAWMRLQPQRRER